jgi:uncharacterized protein YbjQ (UPF0145 family)
MLLTAHEDLLGYQIIETVGDVQGNTVRAGTMSQDFIAGLKTLIGGEVSQYEDLLLESRKEAVSRMVAQAKEMGADAIVKVRFETSNTVQDAAQLFVSGTAVRVKPESAQVK